MKAGQLRDLADQMIGAIHRNIHETRESLEARIRASDTTIGQLHAKVNALEAQVRALEERLTVRRVA